MANNLGVSTGSDATIKTTDNAGIHTPHHNVDTVSTLTTITNVVHVDDNASTLSVDDGAGSLTVDGTVAATQSGSWTVLPGNTANTTPWLAKIGDGTNVANVKAASTAPLASDPALVVALSPNGLNANGRATSANSAPVTLPNDLAASASATFTPAAASHVANDVNGGAQTFASLGLSGSRVMITSATLEIDGATAEATAWTLYIYNVTPPSATADDGAWDLVSGDRASFLGKVDLGTAVDLGSTQWIENHGINKQIKLSGTDVFGYLVNTTTLTPANVAHIVTLHTVQL